MRGTHSERTPRSIGRTFVFEGLTLALLTATLGGCSAVHAPQTPVAVEVASNEDLPALSGSAGQQVEIEERRQVGDLLVHRFAGAFHERELILSEEVIARDGEMLVVEYALMEGDRTDKLRVRMSARSERVVSVAKLVGDEETPGTLADYDALLARTTFTPDQNAGALSTKTETCLVGPQEHDCKISRYKVYVADKEATLTVQRSDAVGRDISGEVTALDGTVLYHAELVEMRRGQEAAPTGTASAQAALRE